MNIAAAYKERLGEDDETVWGGKDNQMDTQRLSRLLNAHGKAPREFQATQYWRSYEKEILNTISRMDVNQLRSGRYPILGTFGFNDVVYSYHPYMALWKKAVLMLLQKSILGNRAVLPYGSSLSSIREMAYHHCDLLGKVSGAQSIGSIEVCTFGNPEDLFEMNGRRFSMQFLGYYIRYCFVRKHIKFKGNEVLVELGPGSGYQIEVLKKLQPELTILCFDLPAQIFLCEEYLAHALSREEIVGTDETLGWSSLSGVKRGRVHMFGSWQFPLLKRFQWDVFWNAASFGEMEPDIVDHYLSYVRGNAKWIYLLQARHGKETVGRARVAKPITFDHYGAMLKGYQMKGEQDSFQAHKRLSASGGYFEAIWLKE